MNIILYNVSQSNYGVLGFFTGELAAVFTKLGHNVTVIDYSSEKEWFDKFRQTINHSGCDFVLGFNGVGIDATIDNRSAYDIVNVPFVAALVDHPCHQIIRLDTKMNHLIVACTDKPHLDFLSSYYPQEHIKLKFFLPQAGTLAQPFNPDCFDDYLEKRTIPVLFAGTFMLPERVWANLSNSDIVSLTDDIVDCVLAHDCIDLPTACNYVLKQRDMELSPELLKKVYCIIMPMVDKYIRAYCRSRCLEVLAKAEIPVASCSEPGTYLSKEKYKSITFIGTRQYQELLRDLQKTRLFLTPTTNLLYGASERIFNAMLNGAVPVSQANYSEEFVDGQDCVLYKWTQLDSLTEKVSGLLANPEKTWQMAKAAGEKAAVRHTWLQRAEKILSMVTLYRILHSLSFKN